MYNVYIQSFREGSLKFVKCGCILNVHRSVHTHRGKKLNQIWLVLMQSQLYTECVSCCQSHFNMKALILFGT